MTFFAWTSKFVIVLLNARVYVFLSWVSPTGKQSTLMKIFHELWLTAENNNNVIITHWISITLITPCMKINKSYFSEYSFQILLSRWQYFIWIIIDAVWISKLLYNNLVDLNFSIMSFQSHQLKNIKVKTDVRMSCQMLRWTAVFIKGLKAHHTLERLPSITFTDITFLEKLTNEISKLKELLEILENNICVAENKSSNFGR